METGRNYILSVSRVAIVRGSAQALSTPQPEPPVDIRFESGDMVEELGGDIKVAPDVDGVPEGTFPWREREA
jgi:hypothetical protein